MSLAGVVREVAKAKDMTGRARSAVPDSHLKPQEKRVVHDPDIMQRALGCHEVMRVVGEGCLGGGDLVGDLWGSASSRPSGAELSLQSRPPSHPDRDVSPFC